MIVSFSCSLNQAAILQHTAEYIDQLEQHKTRLMQENEEIKKLVNPELLPAKYEQSLSTSMYKRIKLEPPSGEVSNSDSSDEGIQCNPSPKNQTFDRNGATNGSGNQLTSNNHIINGATPVSNGSTCDDNASADELRSELIKVRRILDKERKLRMQLEEKVRLLEAQIYPARIKEIAHQVQLQFQTTDKNDATVYALLLHLVLSLLLCECQTNRFIFVCLLFEELLRNPRRSNGSRFVGGR
jgi:transcription factor AP-4